MSNDHDEKLTALVAKAAHEGVKLVIVGSSAGFGPSDLARVMAENHLTPDDVVVIDARPPKIELSITALPKLKMPVLPRPEKEWWRGGSPKHRR